MTCFFCGVSYRLFFSVFFTEEMAMVPMVLIPFMLFGGYFVNQSNVPYYFYPLQYMSMFKYGFQAAVEVKKTVFFNISPVILFRMNSETQFIIVMLRRHQSVTPWKKEIMERISGKVALFWLDLGLHWDSWRSSQWKWLPLRKDQNSNRLDPENFIRLYEKNIEFF